MTDRDKSFGMIGEWQELDAFSQMAIGENATRVLGTRAIGSLILRLAAGEDNRAGAIAFLFDTFGKGLNLVSRAMHVPFEREDDSGVVDELPCVVFGSTYARLLGDNREISLNVPMTVNTDMRRVAPKVGEFIADLQGVQLPPLPKI